MSADQCEGKTTTKSACPWKPVFRVRLRERTPRGVITRDVYVCEVHVNQPLRAGGRAFNLRTPRR